MADEQKPTTVNGEPTGDKTESGNPDHDGSGKFTSKEKEFDLKVSEPFFKQEQNQNFLRSYFKNKGMKISKFFKSTQKNDKFGSDFYAFKFDEKLEGKERFLNIDLKTKKVNNPKDFEKPEIELHLFKTMVDDKTKEIILNNDGEPNLFLENFFADNLTDEYVFNVINGDKPIETIDDIKRNKMYVFNKDEARNYFAKTVGTEEQIKEECSKMIKASKKLEELIKDEKNGIRRTIEYKGEFNLGNDFFVVFNQYKDSDGVLQKSYEIQKRYANGVKLRCTENKKNGTYSFLYRFNAEETIPNFNNDPNYKYDSEQEKQIADIMNLNEEDIQEPTTEEKTLNALNLNKEDINENKTNEEKQADKLFGLEEE